MGLHMFPIPIPSLTSLSTRSLQVFPVHQVRALVSCIHNHGIKCVLQNHPQPWDTQTMLEQLSGKQCEYPVYCNIKLHVHTYTLTHIHMQQLSVCKICVRQIDLFSLSRALLIMRAWVSVFACICVCEHRFHFHSIIILLSVHSDNSLCFNDLIIFP